jgi:hypothetical protein
MRAQRQSDTNIVSNAAIIALLGKIKAMFDVICPPAPPAGISDEEQLARMQCNIRGTLLTLLRKENQDDVLSRAEWHFLANMSYDTYDSAYHQLEVIDRDLIVANMLAFAAAMRLRDEQYPRLANQDADQYYRGNMGFSRIDRNAADLDLQAFVRAGVEGLPRFPSAGCGIFSSRNFDVCLRDEPELDQIRLNQSLKPFLRSILLVCLYGYWKENEEAILTDRDRLDGRKKTEGELSMKNFVALETASNAHFHVSPHATETTISVAIEPRQHQYVFALNDYVELMGFVSMLTRISLENSHATIPGFDIATVAPRLKGSSPRYMLGSGRWRHFFSGEEFEALKDVLEKFMAAQSNSAHLKKLELIYGRI